MTNTNWIAPAMVLATVVWGWFQHRKTKPTDAERAALLATLAQDAAAVVAAAYPGKSWTELLTMIVQRLSAVPSIPTKNAQALEGAAATALVKLRGVAVAGK